MPMIDLLNLEEDSCRYHLIDVCDGLSGREIDHHLPCAHYKDQRLLVWLADTDLAIFTKSTFMNLCDFAENELKVASVVFLLAANHRQKSQYKQMFRVIDVEKMSSTQVMNMLELKDKDALKEMKTVSSFYELNL